ncbi:MAG: translation initiation factor IF-2 [Methyloligellaceae bacterium]
MSETKETGGKTIRGSSKTMTLNLKRTVESGHVRQNFSHGRSKSVLVEKKKKRSIAAPTSAEAVQPGDDQEKLGPTTAGQRTETTAKQPAKAEESKGAVGRALSDEEKDARARALQKARIRQVEERETAEEEEKRQAERVHEAEIARQEAEAQEEEKKREAEAGKTAELSEAPQAEAAPAADTKPKAKAKAKDDAARTPDKQTARPPERVKKPKADRSQARRGGGRVKGRLTIANALDDGQRERSLASLKRKRERLKSKAQTADGQDQKKIVRDVVIPEAITIQELANRMAERAVDVIRFLMNQGQMHKINDIIDADSAQLITEEFGHTVKRVSEADVEEGFIGEEDSVESLAQRAPIVTVMGHVDHGKTSLLDAMRQANVVEGEAGGITQHIGAYQVETENGQKITVIDTPGHEAFTSMRARGAKVTDIVILVVAADDGVMPQTVEAINHARAADVPLIVAINKIDKPDADPKKVRTDLLQHEVVVESMSGDVLEVEVSALKGLNLDKLLEAVVLQSEVLELKANPNRSAEGVVIEAKLDRGRGPVGTALIQRGTLKVGDIVVAGSAWGRVRALINDHLQQIQEAGPSVPVEILGFGSAPEAGDQLAVVDSESRAREITEYRVRKRRETQAAGVGSGLSLEQMMSQLKEEGTKELPLLLKADVQGSVEAILAALQKLGTDEVQARIIHAGVGGITESDIALAAASSAPVIGFNVRANSQAREAAEQDGIEIRYYAVIYDVVDDIKAAMSGLLSPDLRETFLGNAEILEIFNITKVGKVAGCRVAEGKVERGANVRLIRDDVVIHEGKLSTLKRFKDEVKEVLAGQECGMAFENYQDMRAGDVIECFHVEEVKRTL